MSNVQVTDRYLRQSRLLPMDRVAQTTAAVMGVGAIGRQVALMLSTLPLAKVDLVDPDLVEVHNIPTQQYRNEDVGMGKAERTAIACREMGSDSLVGERPMTAQQWWVEYGMKKGVDVVFLCVDSMTARREIGRMVQASLIVDGRMAAECGRVLSISKRGDRSYWMRTLCKDSEVFQETCTRQGTAYCANFAAAVMLSMFTRWLREAELERDVMFNMLADEMLPYCGQKEHKA